MAAAKVIGTKSKDTKASAAKSSDTKGPKLKWPAGAGETPARQIWFARLSTLPPGLTVREAAVRLRRPDGLVNFWLKFFGYRAADGMPARWEAVEARWAGVDWGQPDADIAAKVGVCRQTVRAQRQRRGLPPVGGPDPNSPGERFRAFVVAHPEELAGLTAAEAVARAGLAGELGQERARRALNAAGVRSSRPWQPPRPFPTVDWSLPDTVLARIWGLGAPEGVRARRLRAGAPDPQWDTRTTRDRHDPAYAAAARREERRARNWPGAERGQDGRKRLKDEG